MSIESVIGRRHLRAFLEAVDNAFLEAVGDDPDLSQYVRVKTPWGFYIETVSGDRVLEVDHPDPFTLDAFTIRTEPPWKGARVERLKSWRMMPPWWARVESTPGVDTGEPFAPSPSFMARQYEAGEDIPADSKVRFGDDGRVYVDRESERET